MTKKERLAYYIDLINRDEELKDEIYNISLNSAGR
ncbi:MAG: hypothetical protein BWY61_00749 [Firmicutes bacterium ADurb.Bin354]|nr:MAG: hypothetical protein BWY61_00749 [Firmicutes bacterium ADurb.Bin354]